MTKKVIAIVYGGYSKEQEISLKSAEQVVKTVDVSKYDIYKVLVNREEWTVKLPDNEIVIDKNDFSFLLNGIKIVFDAVLMVIHGTPGEDGKLQSYFEMLGIPVSTSDSSVSALTFNKFSTKVFLKEFGVKTAKSHLVRVGDVYSKQEIIDKLGLPIFVKPNNGGSSFGITKVKSIDQLDIAIDNALKEDNEVIIEEFIQGREFTNGVYISEGEIVALPITEIISQTEFFDYEAKYKGLSTEETPAKLTEEQTDVCKQLSQQIYKYLNCKGVVRIDYLLKDNVFYFMEINTVPGLSEASIIPQQVASIGMRMVDFYTKLIENTINT
jgi:D-alanine-D-alanine ligase